MKYMNMKKRYQTLDLQLFAGEGEGDDGGDAGDDDSDEGSDEDEGEDDPDEKRFSQKDVDDAVKKRLARERRKWQREQKKNKKTDSGDTAGDDSGDGGGESEDSVARKEAEAKANSLEVKVACFEAGVAKDSIDDVTALAKAYMEADEDLDLEDAIEKVVKKYPQFTGSADDDPGEKKGWGQRHNKPPKKAETVDDEIRKQLFGK